MNLKEKIQADFLDAFKNKDSVKKMALSTLKAKITETEKAKKTEIGDDEVLGVIVSAIKQRKQSVEEFIKAGRPDLAMSESAECEILQTYLPPQMSEEEIRERVSWILKELNEDDSRNKKVGYTMGMMNKTYKGQFDTEVLRTVLHGML